MKKTPEVLIVGAGPTGLLLAINLLRNGVTCNIIDKRVDKSSNSKAITVNAASLKILHSIKLIQNFVNYGCMVRDIYVHWNSSKLMHVNYNYLDAPYKYFLSIPQPFTENILLQNFLDLGGKVDFNTELIDIIVSQSGCEAKTNNSHGVIKSKFKYLIGCDGANSKVRQLVGAKFTGKDYEIFFELIDVHLDWDGNTLATHYFVTETCFVIIIPMIDNKHRIVIKNELSSLETVQVVKSIKDYEKIIHRCGVVNLKIKDIIWRSYSKFYNRLIEHYSYNNQVFFAGDASHLFSPIGGLGMNTGLQDAFNLSWRLAGVLKGNYKTQTLDEYCLERRLIGESLIHSTDISTELITRSNKHMHNKTLSSWLPRMQNRDNIRHVFPLNFSGLSHNYTVAGRAIYHIPFAKGVESITNQEISTYDISDGINFHVLLFINMSNRERHMQALNALRDRFKNLIKVWVIIENNITYNWVDPEFTVIFDTYGDFYGKCIPTKANDVLILRPDGYVGFSCALKNLDQIISYLNSYFVQ